MVEDSRFLIEGTVCQIAEVVCDVEQAAKRYWENMRFGPWYFYDIETPELQDVYYKGQEIEEAGFKNAVCQVGHIQYELIQPGHNVEIYSKFMNETGGGLHHLKLYYKDIGNALNEFKKKGIDVLFCGKFGSDAFYYLDTIDEYGVYWEIGNSPAPEPTKKIYPPES